MNISKFGINSYLVGHRGHNMIVPAKSHIEAIKFAIRYKKPRTNKVTILQYL